MEQVFSNVSNFYILEALGLPDVVNLTSVPDKGYLPLVHLPR